MDQQQLSQDARLQILEHLVLAKQEALVTSQEDIKRVLAEIHDKLDDHLLAQTALNTKFSLDIEAAKERHDRLQEEIKNQDKKYIKIIMGLITVFGSLLGGVYSAKGG